MNRERVLIVLVIFAVILALGPVRVTAQTQTTGDITGTVADPSGAVIPDAKVTIKSVEKGWTQQSLTNASGVYRFFLTTPGNFSVTAAHKGFQSTTQEAVVYLGQVATVDFRLKLAAEAQTVTVTEEAPLLQTVNGNLATTLNQKQVQEVPNPGNDLTYIAQVAPGSVMNTQAGYGNFSSYGLPGNANTFTINGMDNNDPYLNLNNSGATNLMLGYNEVQEVSVVTNGYSGQYGGLAGANVNYVTRSGSNEFHGRATYFWNGRVLNANDFLLNASGVERSFSNANQWGADFGGPIKKDKAFFYVDTEGLRVLLPSAPQTVIVPTVAFENATIANLTATGLTKSIPFYQNIFNLYNGAPGISRAVVGNGDPTDPAGCSGFADPTSGLGNVADGGAGVPCARFFKSSVGNATHEWVLATRIDYNLGPNDRLFGRYQKDRGLQATGADLINKVFNVSSDQPQHQGQLIETHTFGAKATNQFILSGAWYSAIFDFDDPAKAHATFAPSLTFRDGAFNSLNGFLTSGAATYGVPQGRIVTQVQVSDDLSRAVGNHALKFGVKYRSNYITDEGFSNRVRGRLRPTIDDFFFGGIDSDSGSLSRIEKRFPTATEQRIKIYTLGGYAEDSWRMKPNFTLTLALRVEHASNPTCKALCFSRTIQSFFDLTHDVTIPYNQFVQPNNKTALPGLTNLEWQPRLGFAWQPFGGRHNLVVRGGIGIFYDSFQSSVANGFANNPPQSNRFNIRGFWLSPDETAPLPGGTTSSTNNNLFGAVNTFNQTFVTGFLSGQNLNQMKAALIALGFSPTTVNRRFVPPNLTAAEAFTNEPQYQKWSLEVQKGLWRNASATIGYVGSHGIHLPIQDGSVNAGVPGFTGLPATRPDLRFLTVVFNRTTGISNYHGMTLSFKQRFSSGLVQVNYTWSRAMDELGAGGYDPFNFNTNLSIRFQEDPNNLRRQYGPADWDAKHYLSANYVWELPVKRAFFGHGPNALVRGWQVSGTVFYRTGLPYTVTDGLNSAVFSSLGYGSDLFANSSGGGVVSCQSLDPTQPPLGVCLDPAKFSSAASGFGNLGRNSFRGPNYFDADFTVMKKTKIPHWERGELGIGFQFYNVFNHANFDQPVQDRTLNPLFGTIQTTVGSPTSILGSFLGGDASPRIIQLKAQITF